ncbi:MAG TPA: DUF1993 domain-containing protein [Steroidobacter sp.]|jgi:hypothetical protein|nr:DUF1993 domain-containing protein [Steroidobacter sp.]
MGISLYDATVRGFLQTLGAVQGFLERGLKHCSEACVDLSEITETRLYPDMRPFNFQIIQAVQHSVGAIEGVKNGVFSPFRESALDYAALQNAVAEARVRLKAYTADEVNALVGRDVVFQMPNLTMPFVAEDFLLSLSVPNFHFHATTAYDILRTKGVPLGKRDYLGQLRVKT